MRSGMYRGLALLDIADNYRHNARSDIKSMPDEYNSVFPVRFPENTFVVGANSRLFNATFPNADYVAVSGRVEAVRDIPSFPDGSTIIIFSDAPSKAENTALLASVVHRLIAIDQFKLIFISSVSALFRDERTGKFAGAYAEKKNAAEKFLIESVPTQNLYIIRLGNAFFSGNWRNIATQSKMLVLPYGFDLCAASSSQDLTNAMGNALSGGPVHVVNAWMPVAVSQYFRKVVKIKGLQSIYNNKALSIGIKIFSKIFSKFGIFIPSPADIDSFNPHFARQASAI